jgi:hypothetical protein
VYPYPRLGRQFEYLYFVEIEGHAADPLVAEAEDEINGGAAGRSLADDAGDPGFLHRPEAMIPGQGHVPASKIQAWIVRGRDFTRHRRCVSRLSDLTAIRRRDIVRGDRGLRRSDVKMPVEDCGDGYTVRSRQAYCHEDAHHNPALAASSRSVRR